MQRVISCMLRTRLGSDLITLLPNRRCLSSNLCNIVIYRLPHLHYALLIYKRPMTALVEINCGMLYLLNTRSRQISLQLLKICMLNAKVFCKKRQVPRRTLVLLPRKGWNRAMALAQNCFYCIWIVLTPTSNLIWRKIVVPDPNALPSPLLVLIYFFLPLPMI